MGPEPIWGSTSNVPFLGRCRAPGELSQFLKWVAFITVMNALQRNDMGADTVLANDSVDTGPAAWRSAGLPNLAAIALSSRPASAVHPALCLSSASRGYRALTPGGGLGPSIRRIPDSH